MPARYYPFAWDQAGYARGRYVVVAGLTPLSQPLVDHRGVAHADDHLVAADDERPAYLAAKRPAPQLDRTDRALRDAVVGRLLPAVRIAYGAFPDAAAPDVGGLVAAIQEDVAVVRIAGTRSRLAYLHVSLPSGWDPEAIAQGGVSTFGRLHAPLATHMGSDAVIGLRGEEWLRTLAAGASHRRFTWGLQLDPGLDQHPARRPSVAHVDDVWLRVERQVTVGLGDAMLFLIRPWVIPLAEVRAAGVLPALQAAVRAMSAGEAAYKLQGRRDEVLAALERG